MMRSFYEAGYLSEIRDVLDRLDLWAKDHGVLLEEKNISGWSGRFTLTFQPAVIVRRDQVNAEQLKRVLGDDFDQVFPDGVIPDVFVVAREAEGGVIGYFNGRDLVTVDTGDRDQTRETSAHELGHVIADRAGTWREDIADRIRPGLGNVELYAHLFPLLVTSDPVAYLQRELPKLERASQVDDAYAVAVWQVLNAFSLALGQGGLPSLRRGPPNQSQINQVLNAIGQLTKEELEDWVREFWDDRDMRYLQIERGKYYQRSIQMNMNGQMVDIPLTEGLNFAPDVEIETVGSEELEIPDIESGEPLVDDLKRPDRRMDRYEKRELPATLRYWMNKYIKLFAGEEHTPEVRTVPDGGTAINPQALLEGDAANLFVAPNYEDEDRGLAQNIIFAFDVSGSITSNETLKSALTEMVYQHFSMLERIARRNPDLNLSLVTISTYAEVVFDFNAWRQAKGPQAKRRLVEEGLARMWQTGDGGGLSTPQLLEAVEEMDIPSPVGKQTKNLLVVFTDGQEPGGGSLQERITQFRDGASGTGRRRTSIDPVFVSIETGGETEQLAKNYPTFMALQGELSAYAYLEALFKVALLQVKGRLEGNLSPQLDQMSGSAGSAGSSSSGTAFNQQASRFENTTPGETAQPGSTEPTGRVEPAPQPDTWQTILQSQGVDVEAMPNLEAAVEQAANLAEPVYIGVHVDAFLSAPDGLLALQALKQGIDEALAGGSMDAGESAPQSGLKFILLMDGVETAEEARQQAADLARAINDDPDVDVALDLELFDFILPAGNAEADAHALFDMLNQTQGVNDELAIVGGLIGPQAWAQTMAATLEQRQGAAPSAHAFSSDVLAENAMMPMGAAVAGALIGALNAAQFRRTHAGTFAYNRDEGDPNTALLEPFEIPDEMGDRLRRYRQSIIAAARSV